MAIKVEVRKIGKQKWIKMHGGKNTEANWMTPVYAWRLAARLMKASNDAETITFKVHKR